MKFFIICFIACAQLSHGEDVTLVATSTEQVNNEGEEPMPPVRVDSETVTLHQGDTAKLLYISQTSNAWFVSTINLITFDLAPHESTANPFTITGPATIRMRTDYSSCVATLSITRAGIASPPASIPQEAGTTWDVILESSSDLINWTLANPGEFSGTEPKRFFRTRIVKKP